MEQPTQYWTQAFIDAYVQALHQHPGFQKASRKFEGSFILRCWDLPTGQDAAAIYHVNRGQVRAQTRFEKAPSVLRDEPFDKKHVIARTSAPYDLWVRLDRGDINIVQGLASSDYKVDGKLKILANMNMFNIMSEIAASLPKQY